MKKLFLLLSLILMTTVCGAQVKVQTNKEGAYQIKPDSLEWVDAGFTVSPEALKYYLNFPEAKANPGKEIEVGSLTKALKFKFLFKEKFEVTKRYIVYNEKTNNIDFIESAPKIEEESSSFVLFGIIPLFLMMLSGVLFKKRIIAAIIAAISAFVVFIFSFSFLFSALSLVLIFNSTGNYFIVGSLSTLAAVSGSCGVIAILARDKKWYKIFAVLFYALMIISIILMFV